MNSEITDVKVEKQAVVSSSEFRIVEYKDHFRVQKKSIIDKPIYFLRIPIGSKEKEVWNTIMKNKSFLGINNWSETENYQFKTKEESLEWIEDYNKYPVYHYC